MLIPATPPGRLPIGTRLPFESRVSRRTGAPVATVSPNALGVKEEVAPAVVIRRDGTHDRTLDAARHTP